MNARNPNEGEIPALRQLWQLAFGDEDAFLDAFFETAYSPRRCLCLEAEGRLLAAAYWLPCSLEGRQYAYIYAVATHPQARNRGLCRKLMEAIHGQLAQEGYVGALLVPGDPGLGTMYAKMGYGFFGGMDAISCPAGEAVPVQAVTAAEFMALRRAFLPQGGLLQEAQSLAFLARQASFAAGEDFLLAYRREEDRILGLELLGNREQAPGIVAGLGASAGSFRCPGTGTFAMYKPLLQGPTPGYLGFAFD